MIMSTKSADIAKAMNELTAARGWLAEVVASTPEPGLNEHADNAHNTRVDYGVQCVAEAENKLAALLMEDIGDITPGQRPPHVGFSPLARMVGDRLVIVAPDPTSLDSPDPLAESASGRTFCRLLLTIPACRLN
jgi:hypothetical protein